MDNELELRIQRTDRLGEALSAIGKFLPRFKNQDKIARAIGYRRAGTISNYKNPDNYSEENFTVFVNELNRVFFVNPEFVLNGKEPIIKVDPARVYVLYHELIHIMELGHQQFKEEAETNAPGKVKSLQLYMQNDSILQEVAERLPAAYKDTDPAVDGFVLPSLLPNMDKKKKVKKAPKKGNPKK